MESDEATEKRDRCARYALGEEVVSDRGVPGRMESFVLLNQGYIF